ncbi:hypothetical protein C2G38_2150480 [Gigaspora rosea]|uniref:Uncharacterized protein n=1 Tax=Gigaspora rosea TaxID=44941 RepID=A0A397U2U7_9GLOM|nr:hypothetical protein C2G38_2150480 [Gigaspora rosea]
MDIQTKSDKILSPEYLDWYYKLTDLPTTISDKLRSKLYKIYKKKTGLDPWIKSENPEPLQSENADNHIIQDSSLETQGLRKIGGPRDVFVGIWKEIYVSIVVE